MKYSPEKNLLTKMKKGCFFVTVTSYQAATLHKCNMNMNKPFTHLNPSICTYLHLVRGHFPRKYTEICPGKLCLFVAGLFSLLGSYLWSHLFQISSSSPLNTPNKATKNACLTSVHGTPRSRKATSAWCSSLSSSSLW